MKIKRLVATAFMTILLMMPAIAADSIYSDINSYIDRGMDENFYEIKTRSQSLSLPDRQTLYNLKKKDFIRPQELNTVPGFGTGSFLQGDDYGGRIALIGEATSVIVIWALTKDNKTKAESDAQAVACYAWIGFKLFEIFRPPIYTNDYNKKLEEALGLTAQILPGENGRLALKLSTSF